MACWMRVLMGDSSLDCRCSSMMNIGSFTKTPPGNFMTNNAEKITHGIFYTAITRAKKKLKIYWSSETMHEVIESFYKDERKGKSLEIIKAKLSVN